MTEEIINDNAKFSKLDIPNGKQINPLEERNTSKVKLLKDKKLLTNLLTKV